MVFGAVAEEDDYEDYDDYYGDYADGFGGYIPKTKHPGFGIMVAVIVYTIFSVAVVPALVVVGERYEKQRKAFLITESEDVEHDEGDVEKLAETSPNTPESKTGPRDSGFENEEWVNNNMEDAPRKRIQFPFKTKKGDSQNNSLGMEAQEEGLCDNPVISKKGVIEVQSATPVTVSTPTKRSATTASAIGRHNATAVNHAHPAMGMHVGNRRTARSAVSGAMSATGSAVSGISKLNRAAATAFDKIMVPLYPDDDPEYKSVISARGRMKARSTLSGVTSLSHRMASSEIASSINGRAPSFLDATVKPGVGGRGRRRLHRKPAGRIDTINKTIEQEDRATGGGKGAEWAQQDRFLADNNCDLRSGVSQTQTELRQKNQTRGDRKKSAMSDLATSTLNICEDEETLANQQRAAWDMHHVSTRPRIGGRNGSGGTAISAQSGFAASDIRSALKAGEQHGYVDDITPNDAADADDPGRELHFREKEDVPVTVFFGPGALWRPHTIHRAINSLLEIADPDAETNRIVRLAIPYTLSEMVGTISDMIEVVIVSRTLGTDPLTAFVVTDVLIGLTDEFLMGVSSAQDTISAHAIGAGNNLLAGQYLQICAIVFALFSTPFYVLWSLVMDDALLFLGLSPHVAQIGLEFTRVTVFHYFMDGVAGCFFLILDITGHEDFGFGLELAEAIIGTIVLLSVLIPSPNATLVTVAIIDLGISFVFYAIYFSWAVYKGWFDSFWKGIFHSFAFKNKKAVSNLLRTAVPLSIGTFLEYGEWELLTFFIAYMGPAEVAAWSLLGSVWSLFESATNGLGSAAGVRVAYHLGKGNATMAKKSAYKSLLLSALAACFITSILFMCGRNLSTWFTTDATLQHMLNDCIPLIGLGNLTMTFGMVSWSLVGAQGRYRLATGISLVSSWLITIPMAIIVIFGLRLDLTGVVGAVVIGYSTSSAALAYVLIRSDWERLSKIILELNALTGEVYSSDEEDGSSSSSSESDSSDSDDSDSEDDDKVSDLR